MNDGAETVKQLEAIASLGTTLDRHGIDYWVFGGWAVDFWVGSVTRVHDDIDIAAWRRDYDTIKTALLEDDWHHTPVPNEVVGTRYEWGAGVQVEFTFLVTDGTGAVLVPMPEQAVVWSPRPFGDTRRELRGVVARTLPLELLKAGKGRAREGVLEGAKDRADHAALLERFPQSALGPPGPVSSTGEGGRGCGLRATASSSERKTPGGIG